MEREREGRGVGKRRRRGQESGRVRWRG